MACPRPHSQGRAGPGTEHWPPHPFLPPHCSAHCELEGKDKAEQKRKKETEAGKCRMKVDNCCSLGSADTEGDVARNGLRPGRLCVSRGMGPRRDDHHPTAGPAGHG